MYSLTNVLAIVVSSLVLGWALGQQRSRFHCHHMLEHCRTFAEPILQTFKYEGLMNDNQVIKWWIHSHKMRSGVTTVLLKCSVEGCTKTKIIEMLGKEVDALERMVR